MVAAVLLLFSLEDVSQMIMAVSIAFSREKALQVDVEISPSIQFSFSTWWLLFRFCDIVIFVAS